MLLYIYFGKRFGQTVLAFVPIGILIVKMSAEGLTSTGILHD